jgi:hypothetical protein
VAPRENGLRPAATETAVVADTAPARAESKPREPEERSLAQAGKDDARRTAPSVAKAAATQAREDRVNSPAIAVPTRKPEETAASTRTHMQGPSGSGYISPIRDPGF